jgi:hypothetical protein
MHCIHLAHEAPSLSLPLRHRMHQMPFMPFCVFRSGQRQLVNGNRSAIKACKVRERKASGCDRLDPCGENIRYTFMAYLLRFCGQGAEGNRSISGARITHGLTNHYPCCVLYA